MSSYKCGVSSVVLTLVVVAVVVVVESTERSCNTTFKNGHFHYKCSCGADESLHLSEEDTYGWHTDTKTLQVDSCRNNVELGPGVLDNLPYLTSLSLTNISTLILRKESLLLEASIDVLIDSVGDLRLDPEAVVIEPLVENANIGITLRNSVISHLPKDAIVYEEEDDQDAKDARRTNMIVQASNNTISCESCKSTAWLTSTDLVRIKDNLKKSLRCIKGDLNDAMTTCSAPLTSLGSLLVVGWALLFPLVV